MNKDKKLWGKILGLKGLASIGFADTIGSGITAIFWFFIASQLSSSVYGEIHYYLGLEDEAKKYANILGYNYNSSQWFEQSYKVLNKNYEINRKIKKENKTNFFQKILQKIK